jgi:prefoldin alpha subunit
MMGGGGGGQMQAIQQELQAIEQEKEAVKEEIQGVRDEQAAIDEAIEALSGLETDSVVQVPLGGGAYVRATIEDIDEVIVDLGADFAAERDQDGAAESLRSKKELLDEQIAELKTEVAELDGEADQLEQQAQQMQQQQMQQMQAQMQQQQNQQDDE